MQRPVLYTYRRCPYAMRARMALLQAHIAFEAHEIVLRDKPPELLKASPKGTVPVLVLPGGRVIDESLDVMRWAFDGRDGAGWWERAQSEACKAWVATNDGPFKQLLALHEEIGGRLPRDHVARKTSCERGRPGTGPPSLRKTTQAWPVVRRWAPHKPVATVPPWSLPLLPMSP